MICDVKTELQRSAVHMDQALAVRKRPCAIGFMSFALDVFAGMGYQLR